MKSLRPGFLLLVAVTVQTSTPFRKAWGSETAQPYLGITHTEIEGEVTLAAYPDGITTRHEHIHIIIVDLAAPGIHFQLTPYVPPSGEPPGTVFGLDEWGYYLEFGDPPHKYYHETDQQTTVDYLNALNSPLDQRARVAINVHFFEPWPPNPDDPDMADLVGLAASSAHTGPNGHAYSPFEGNPVKSYAILPNARALNIAEDNTVTIVHAKYPENAGYSYETEEDVELYNTLSGSAQIVVDGVNAVFDIVGQPNINPEWYTDPINYSRPRSAIGVTQDGGSLVILTVDQGGDGDSEGMTVFEVANFMLQAGVWNAINLDGGGSTTLAMVDPNDPNHEAQVVNGANYGHPESPRPVGSSLAIYADPILAPPIAAAAGSRCLAITPPPEVASVALQVSSEALACLPQYVDTTGRLVQDPVFTSSAEWGTVHVADRALVPQTLYEVRARVGSEEAAYLSPPAWAVTSPWGDVNNDGLVTVLDILCVLDGVQGIFGLCTAYHVDLRGDVPDGVIDESDVEAVLNAFQGGSYPDAEPCAR